MYDPRDETNCFLAMPEERLGPNESGFEAWAQTLSEAERREMGSTPDERAR
jgi:hypothetical protein